jgi:hypothetical protein
VTYQRAGEIGVLRDGANHNVSIGDHTENLTAFHDRQDPDVCFAHPLGGLGERCRWLDGDDLANHHVSDFHSDLL